MSARDENGQYGEGVLGGNTLDDHHRALACSMTQARIASAFSHCMVDVRLGRTPAGVDVDE